MLNPNYISIIIITQNSYEEQIHTKKTRSSLNSVDIPFVSFSLRGIKGREREDIGIEGVFFFFNFKNGEGRRRIGFDNVDIGR